MGGHFSTFYFIVLSDVSTESRDGSSKRGSTDDDKQILSESDAFINKNLEGIQDQDFRSLFQLPPEKVPNVLSLCQFGQEIRHIYYWFWFTYLYLPSGVRTLPSCDILPTVTHIYWWKILEGMLHEYLVLTCIIHQYVSNTTVILFVVANLLITYLEQLCSSV